MCYDNHMQTAMWAISDSDFGKLCVACVSFANIPVRNPSSTGNCKGKRDLVYFTLIWTSPSSIV